VPRKQRHTARRILARLIEEHGAEEFRVGIEGTISFVYTEPVAKIPVLGHRLVLRRKDVQVYVFDDGSLFAVFRAHSNRRGRERSVFGADL
jgi:hypothetical protein